MRSFANVSGLLAASTIIALVACGSSARDSGKFDNVSPTDPKNPDGSNNGTGTDFGSSGNPGMMPDGTPGGETRDPVDCAEAKASHSYVGCDYWPTVTANAVWSIFDYAVVVANTGATNADVKVAGPGGFTKSATVAPGELKRIYLPWVKDLKGPDATNDGAANPMTASVFSAKGAYHLESSSPVIVYQFNALEYKGAGGENADGTAKDWSKCPGGKTSCFSYSNDASLLLPSTAMTGNYRVTGIHGWTSTNLLGSKQDVMGAYFTITATQDGTDVTVKLSSTSKVLAGGAVQAAGPSGTLTLHMDAGDVAEVVGEKGQAYDFSGSLVTATKPVQLITGIACINLPSDKSACDHVEESVSPVETLGKHYVVTVPTSPNGKPVEHILRLYGNVDGTALTYSKKPKGCPDMLNAGQVADCDVVTDDIEITGDHEFAVSSFQVGAAALANDPLGLGNQQGDPSQSIFASVEQFRLKYLFLAPTDYDVNYADIVGPSDAEIVLDGAPVAGFTPIGGAGFGVYRVKLAGQSGAHTLTSKKAVGLQIMGYGANTSYQYPGGLNLKLIASVPVR